MFKVVHIIFLTISFCTCQNIITTIDSIGQGASLYSSISIPSDGLPIIAYYEDILFNGNLKVVKCGNASCSSGNTISVVDSEGDVGRYLSIAIPLDDLPIISYYSEDSSNFGLKVLKCGNVSCTSGNTITAVDTPGYWGQYNSITVPPDGFPVICYYDNSNDNLKVLKCGNTSCSSRNSISTVDSLGNVGWYTSIAVSSDDYPIISYYDFTNKDLKVLKCGNDYCSSGNTVTSVDTLGLVGRWTSIAIPLDGLPIISYYDSISNLRVLKCGNASCSSGNIITKLDTVGSLGRYSSIAISNDGLPIISYYNSTEGNLKVLKCGNASCTSGNIITTVDDNGNVGSYNSIAISQDGMPVISYGRIDPFTGYLKVIKCNSPDCSDTTSAIFQKIKSQEFFNYTLLDNNLELSIVTQGFLEIFKVSGEKYFKGFVEKNERIKISNLRQGIYFVKMKSPKIEFIQKITMLR